MTKQLWIAAALLTAACTKSNTPAAPVSQPSSDEANVADTATDERLQSHDDTALTARNPGAAAPHEDAAIALDPGATDPDPVADAVAVMMPTKGNKVTGEIHFSAVDNGLAVRADIKGLPKGAHAFHVHEFGNCASADGESAGAHFHFTGSSHDPDVPMITGNLGELVAQSDGTATLEAVIPDARLQGRHTILGRSVVIHEKRNDPSHPPDGAAGKRLACGVIGIRGTSR